VNETEDREGSLQLRSGSTFHPTVSGMSSGVSVPMQIFPHFRRVPSWDLSAPCAPGILRVGRTEVCLSSQRKFKHPSLLPPVRCAWGLSWQWQLS